MKRNDAAILESQDQSLQITGESDIESDLLNHLRAEKHFHIGMQRRVYGVFRQSREDNRVWQFATFLNVCFDILILLPRAGPRVEQTRVESAGKHGGDFALEVTPGNGLRKRR